MANLTGRTALVTGASRGIGRAIAERLAADGARVGVHYGTNESAAADVVTTIEASGGKAFAIGAELGVAGDVERLFVGLEGALDGQPLDILVNNAGMLDGTPLGEVTADAFDRSFAVNVRAPFLITQRALGLLRDGGRIVNVSSATTRIAAPFVHYAMAKGALEVMSHALAQALGPRKITVNAVAPGVVDTDMGAWARDENVRAAITSTTALGGIADATDVADVVAFLVSNDARWVTGVTVDVSGGQWLGPSMG